MDKKFESNKVPNKQLLHYGCLIYLTYKDDQGQEFYVTADGYTKNKIQIKTKEEILKDSSISASLFKIYPTFYNNEYVKTRKKYDQKRNQKKLSTKERREAQSEIPKQIKAMEEETALNYEKYEKFKGSPVIFGQTIQLLHINSNKYLFYDMNHVSEFESSNLKVGFKDEHSDETCYRILPCYTFQQEGSGNIYNEDIINIVSTVDQMKKIGGEPYLHASKAKISLDKNGDQKERREVNISTEKKTPWKIHIFSEYIDERDGFLCVQDSVWINYSEEDLNLIVQRHQSNQFQVAKQTADEFQIVFEGCTSSANYNKFVGNSNGMFTIESEQILQGGLVHWNNSNQQSRYRLRHLTTKQYLKVHKSSLLDQEFLLECVRDYQSASLFSFELIYSTLTSYNREKAQQFLQRDSYFRLSTKVEWDGDVRSVYSIEKRPEPTLATELWMKTSKVPSEEEQEVEQHYPAFNFIKKEEFVFKLAKANFNEVRMTNFLLACLKTIRGAEQYLDPGFLSSYTMNDERFQQRYKNFLEQMTRLEKCLQDLDLFCHNKLIAYLYIDQEYGQVNGFIQNVLREQWFIEMLVRMLCLAFPSFAELVQLKEVETLDETVEVSRIRSGDEQRKAKQAIQTQIKREFLGRKKKVCGLIYKLLGGMCKHNEINQLQTSKYLPIFAQQSLFLQQALDCIIEVIRDSEELLFNIHVQVDDQGPHHNNSHRSRSPPLKKSASSKSQRHHKELTLEDHIRQYDRVASQIQGADFDVVVKWDLLLFFSSLLKDKSSSAAKKRELIQMLQFASTYRGRGINVNQERVYSCLLAQDTFESLFENEVLIKIQTEGVAIKVYFQGEERILLEFFSKDKKVKNQQMQTFGQEQELGQSKYLSMFLRKQAITTPSSQVPTQTVLNLISDQIDFYSSMCASRNNTWKRSLKTFLPVGVLMHNLIDITIGFNMRATICQFMNKLYVDQEPRRAQVYPELCKILHNQAAQGGDQLQDPELDDIQTRSLAYIQTLSQEVERLSDTIELKDADSSKLEKLRVISVESPKIYNNLTQEVVKLQKLLIDFGRYQIRLGVDDADTKRINVDFFGLLQALFVILEFDQTYPEARKILLEKRREEARLRSEMPTQFLGNMMGAFGKGLGMLDVFGLMDEEKDEKKKTKQALQEGQQMNQDESFLKQSDVLKKILSKLLEEGKDADLMIKLEVCDILNQYLDQKMDFCLNLFKDKFQEYVAKLNLIEKLESGELNLNLDADRKIIQEQFKRVFTTCIEAIIPPIMRTGTQVDKTDPKLSQEESAFGFANLANLANLGGVSPEGPNRDIESIDINHIVGFEIFPTLITLFCMTQSLNMETKLLNVLTRFYNQRLEFAELISKMLLLFDGDNIKIFGLLKRKLRRLAKNIDESEIWLQNLSQPEHQLTLQHTTEFFAYFNQLLFAHSHLNGEEVVCPQELEVDAVRQDIMRNLDVYKLGVALVKDNIYLVEASRDPRTRANLQELFRSCFTFLKNFVQHNVTNQLVLAEQVVTFLMHLETDLGQVALINEIFRNNKKICLERTHLIMDDLVTLIRVNGRQAQYLEFFLIIQRVKKEYLQSNQKTVLNVLMEPRHKQHLFTLKDRTMVAHTHHDAKTAQQMIIKHEFDFEELRQLDNPHYKDEPFIYHAKFLEVLYTCAIGKEGMLQNETRLRATISVKYALELLTAKDSLNVRQSGNLMSFKHQDEEGTKYPSKLVSQIKVPTLLYIFYAYLETEKIADELFRVIGEVHEYVQAERVRLELNEPLSEEFVEYFFTHFIMVMSCWLKIYQREQKEQNQLNQNQQVLQQSIEELMTEVDKLRSVIRSLEVEQLKLTATQHVHLSFFLADDILKAEQLHQQSKEVEEQEKQELALKALQQQELDLKKSRRKTKTFISNMLTKKSTRPRPENFSVDEAWKGLWDQYLNTFLNSKELGQEIEAEHFVFAKALDKVEEIYTDSIMSEYINKNQIFKKLIQFLHKGHDQAGSTPTIKAVLRALSNYIVISQDNIDQDAEEDERVGLAQEEKSAHQNFLNNSNAMTIVLMLLSDYKDEDRYEAIFNPLISFGIMLLDGGNREVQKSVYNFFLNYTTSEVFFLRLHEKFDEERMQLKADEQDDTIVTYAFQKQPDAMNNTLRFMQLFAEGHYRELQNYVRFQQMNYHTYDLFTDVVELLESYLTINKEKYFPDMIQCFDTITEFVQGPCIDNQIALFQANFLDMASNLLTVDEIVDELDRNIAKSQLVDDEDAVAPFPRWMQSRLKYKCSITLLSLLEARTSNDIVIRLIKSLNLDMLKRNIVDIFHMFQKNYKEDYCQEIFLHFNVDPETETEADIEYSSFIIETGFNLYVLFSIFVEVKEAYEDVKVQEDEEDSLQKFLQNSILGKIMSLFLNLLKGVTDKMLEMKNQAQQILMGKKHGAKNYELIKAQLNDRRARLFKKSMKFFSTHSVHIEVLREDKMIEKTYFYLPPFCFSLDKEAKTKFNQGASRISVKAKVTSLLLESDDLIKSMKLNYQLNLWLQNFKLLAVLVANIDLLRDIAFLLALAINLMVLLSFKRVNDDASLKIIDVIITLGTIVIVFSMLIVVYFLAKTAPLIIKKAWVGAKKDQLNIVKILLRILKTIYCLVSDFYILYYLIYGITAIIGTILNPFFFAFHLFDVLVRFPVLLNVVKAVWIPKKSIMFTLFLFVVLMYVFSLFSYYFLYESYTPGYCDSTWQCLLTAIDRSFKYDGGLGGFMTPATDVVGREHDLGYFMVRFFFDNIYFILLMIIMINIVSGIIIDTFGTLREELNKYNYDLENYCFICGFDKETIEKSSSNQCGFGYHIKNEHYMWNYLFYIAYIQNKDPTEFTAIESYVAEKMDDEDISWFPSFKALCMKDDSEEQEQAIVMKQLTKIHDEQEQLQHMLETINEQMEEIEGDHNII